MLVNLAIGGTQGGDPSATEFPARYEIDYIRVYQPIADQD
jgi:beta-glucanase (GH16 family)